MLSCVRRIKECHVTPDLRILIDTFCKRLLHDIPVSIYRNAREDGCDDSSYSTSNTNTHYNINRGSRIFESEDAPILQQDGKFRCGQSHMVGYYAEEKVLSMLESGIQARYDQRTFKSSSRLVKGTLAECLPLPYLAPCIKHTELHIENNW